MTLIEKVENILQVGLVKNTFSHYELFIPEIREEFDYDDIDDIINIGKSIVILINNDNTLIELEVSEIMKMI